jgi:hypothetical protein
MLVALNDCYPICLERSKPSLIDGVIGLPPCHWVGKSSGMLPRQERTRRSSGLGLALFLSIVVIDYPLHY